MPFPSLHDLAEQHSINLDTDPVYAHWSSAGFAIAAGVAMGAARGAVTALMSPPAHRLEVFMFVTRGAAPLYVIPFMLGMQWDCYRTTWSRKNRGLQLDDGLDSVSGAADIG